MASFLRFLESIKLFLFLFGICIFDISTKSGIKIETRPIHIVLIVVVFAGYIVGLSTVRVGDLGNYGSFNKGLSGAVLFSVALIMAASSFLLMLFSLSNRKNQISLLRKIAAFDQKMCENVAFRIHRRKHRTSAMSHMIVYVIYEVLLFVTQVMLKYHDNVHLLLFFVFYCVSDVSLTAHSMYVIMFGKFLINRYDVLNHELKTILTVKGRPIRKRFSLLISLYEKLFRLQLLVAECFGTLLLFVIAFHTIAFTVSFYVFMNDILIDFKRFFYYQLTYVSWMLPYYVRIIYIASTFETVTSQVCLESFFRR